MKIGICLVLASQICWARCTLSIESLALKSYSLDEDDFLEVLRYALQGHSCAQVYMEDSHGASKTLEVLHASPLAPSLLSMTGSKGTGPYGRLPPTQCSRFLIYLATRTTGLEHLLAQRPPSRTSFLMILIQTGQMEDITPFLQRAPEHIENAKGILVLFKNVTYIYKYSSLQKTFSLGTTGKIFSEEKVHKGQRYEDFTGLHLKVGTFNCSIHSRIGPLDLNGKPKWIGGVEMKFLDELSRKLNFSYEVVLPPGNVHSVGQVSTTGVLEGGLVALAAQGRADVVFCGIWLTGHQRNSTLTSTHPITDSCLTFLVPRPVPFSQTGLGLFSSFEWKVWATVAGEGLLTTCLLSAHAWLLNKFDHQLEAAVQGYRKFGKSLLMVWAILFSNAPKSLSCLGPLRHILSWWAILALLLDSTFSSSLIAHLTKVLYSAPYDSFETLVDLDFYWSTETFSTFDSVFDLENKWEKKWIERHVDWTPTVECKELSSREPRLALFATSFPEGLLIRGNLSCKPLLNKYQAMASCFSRQQTGFILQERSPYTHIFSDYISRYQEAGVFMREYREEFHLLALKEPYVYEAKIPISKNKNFRMKLKLENIIATYYLFSLGIGISMSVFLIELLWFYRAKDWMSSLKRNLSKS